MRLGGVSPSLAEGLFMAIAGDPTAGQRVDLITGEPLVVASGTPTWRVRRAGYGRDYSSAHETLVDLPVRRRTAAVSFAIFMESTSGQADTNFHVPFSKRDLSASFPADYFFYFKNSTPEINFAGATAGGGFPKVTLAETVPTDEPVLYGMTRTPDALTAAIYKNGILKTRTAVSPANAPNTTTAGTSIGAYKASTDTFAGAIYWLLGWGRELTPTEMLEVALLRDGDVAALLGLPAPRVRTLWTGAALPPIVPAQALVEGRANAAVAPTIAAEAAAAAAGAARISAAPEVVPEQPFLETVSILDRVLLDFLESLNVIFDGVDDDSFLESVTIVAEHPGFDESFEVLPDDILELSTPILAAGEIQKPVSRASVP